MTPTIPLESHQRSMAGTCHCGATMARIDLVIDGVEVTMRSCTPCDSRIWSRGDQDIAFEEVLVTLSAAEPRYRHDLTGRPTVRSHRGLLVDVGDLS